MQPKLEMRESQEQMMRKSEHLLNPCGIYFIPWPGNQFLIPNGVPHSGRINQPLFLFSKMEN